jgi:hypothetical protein
MAARCEKGERERESWDGDTRAAQHQPHHEIKSHEDQFGDK